MQKPTITYEAHGSLYPTTSLDHTTQAIPTLWQLVAKTAELDRFPLAKLRHLIILLGPQVPERVTPNRPCVQLARHCQSLWLSRLRPLCKFCEEPI